MIVQVSTTPSRYQYRLGDIQIFIGRNAKANTQLVVETKEQLKEDKTLRAYWMHLGEHSSSHGVVVVPQGQTKQDIIEACKFVKEWLLAIAKTKGLKDYVVFSDLKRVRPLKSAGSVIIEVGTLMTDSTWIEQIKV